MAGFRVIIPDARYKDDAAVERAIGGSGFDFEVHRARTHRDIPEANLRGADALLVWNTVPISREMVGLLDNCRLVMRAGVGFDHIDLAACAEAAIPVCNTPDYGTSEVADHAMALLLGLRRGVFTYQSLMIRDAEANFDFSRAGLVGRLRGRTMGIVGLGRIGTATALRAKAFGMRLAAFDPYLSEGQEIAVGVERMKSLEELLGHADVVSVHTPLTEETRGMIDAQALAAMKPGALLINTARGAIVDLEALLAALRSGHIGGAGIDVFPQEPPPRGHPLIAALAANEDGLQERLLVSPHAAWSSPESFHDARRLSAERLVNYLNGGLLRCCVNAAHRGAEAWR